MITSRRLLIDKILIKKRFYGKVLDVGGKKINPRGNFIAPINKVKSWKYLNIDKKTNPDYLCDAEKIPLDSKSQDFILLIEVIEHLENPEIVIAELHRLLSKNGELILTIPFLFPIHSDPFDYQRWTPEKINLVLKEYGFKNITINPMGSLFAVIHDLFYVASGHGAVNRNSMICRFTRRVILPIIRIFEVFFDKKLNNLKRFITTGFYIEAKKK